MFFCPLLNTFRGLGEYARTELSLQRELDLEVCRGSKNHTFLVFFQALISSAFLDDGSFDILCFFVILVALLGFVWRPSGEPKGEIKALFSPDAPRRGIQGPFGEDLGGIWDVCVCLFSMIFWLSYSSVFDIGDV